MSARRCTATTKRGSRCERKKRYADGLCRIHHRLRLHQPVRAPNGHSQPSNGSEPVAQANGQARDTTLFDIKDFMSRDIRWLVTKGSKVDLQRVERLHEALVG